jgi:hypothetical protein
MKGMVFAEFLEMVEARFGEAMVDDIIDDAALASDGAYTSVGTYDHGEFFALVAALSRRTEQGSDDLVRAFGQDLLGRFAHLFPHLLGEVRDAFALLERVEGYIHVEVRKLYPDAELPTFTCERPDERTLVMTYRSARGLAVFAHGLILGAVRHFGEPITVVGEDLSDGRRTTYRFHLTRA